MKVLLDIVLDSDLTLLDQIDWDLKPYVFILKYVHTLMNVSYIILYLTDEWEKMK